VEFEVALGWDKVGFIERFEGEYGRGGTRAIVVGCEEAAMRLWRISDVKLGQDHVERVRTTRCRQEGQQVGAILMSSNDDHTPLLPMLGFPGRWEPSNNTTLTPRMLKPPHLHLGLLVHLGNLGDMLVQPLGGFSSGG